MCFYWTLNHPYFLPSSARISGRNTERRLEANNNAKNTQLALENKQAEECNFITVVV